jgi:hypothetical protein
MFFKDESMIAESIDEAPANCVAIVSCQGAIILYNFCTPPDSFWVVRMM